MQRAVSVFHPIGKGQKAFAKILFQYPIKNLTYWPVKSRSSWIFSRYLKCEKTQLLFLSRGVLPPTGVSFSEYNVRKKDLKVYD